jgi:hypothetical protein
VQGGTVQQHVTSGQAAAAGSDGRRRWARRCNALVLDALRAVHDGGSARVALCRHLPAALSLRAALRQS